jgi:Ras-related protein Rab-5C
MATTTKVKLVLLGDTDVGKTCIVQRYVNNDFKDDHTIGVNFLRKTVLLGERKVELEIWDTAGQETYRSILPLYYRGAAVVVVVFDITNKMSLEQAKWWVRQAKQECAADVVIALVGNKYDLAEQGERDVTNTEAAKYAESEGLLHIETSGTYFSGRGCVLFYGCGRGARLRGRGCAAGPACNQRFRLSGSLSAIVRCRGGPSPRRVC